MEFVQISSRTHKIVTPKGKLLYMAQMHEINPYQKAWSKKYQSPGWKFFAFMHLWQENDCVRISDF